MKKSSIKYYVLSIKDKGAKVLLGLIRLSLLLLIPYYLFLITYSLLLIPSGAFAQSPSPAGEPTVTASPTPTPKATKDESATKSATDEVRERVRKKIENLVKKPRAIVGTLAEITDSTLKITTQAGKQEMVATTKETSYVRVSKGKRAEIKLEELVIGDFIVAMGYKNGNNILEARRVISYDKSPFAQRRAVYGVGEVNEKGVLTIKHPKTGTSWKVKTTSKTKITQKKDSGFEEIKPQDIAQSARIVAAGTLDEKDPTLLLARRIHVIPGAAQGLTGTPPPAGGPTKSPSPTPKSTPSLSPQSTPSP